MAFQKGKSGNPSGRPPGTKNKVTQSFRELLQMELATLGPERFHKWATKHETQFYQICTKLIPSEITAVIRTTPPLRTYEEILEQFERDHGEHGERVMRLLNKQITPEQFAKEVLKPTLELVADSRPKNLQEIN